MDIKLSLIEGRSPNTSKAFDNNLYATNFLNFDDINEPINRSAYQPFFATDVEISNLSVILEQNSLFRFYQIEKQSSGVSKYNLRANEEIMSTLGEFFVTEFYETYFQHVTKEFKDGVNNRFSWINNINIDLIKKIDDLLGADLNTLQQQCLKEADELERKLNRSSIGTVYEDSKSERKVFLKLKVSLNRNIGNNMVDAYKDLVKDVQVDDDLYKNLQDMLLEFKMKFPAFMKKFINTSKKLAPEKRNVQNLRNDLSLMFNKHKPKSVDTLNNQLDNYFEICEETVDALRTIVLHIRKNAKILISMKNGFKKEEDIIATYLMISLISENFEKVQKHKKLAQKTFNKDLSDLKNLLKDKIQIINALIRKKNRQLEAEDIKIDNENADPELQSMINIKRNYEQKIQYEEYLYTNKLLIVLKSQYKLLKRNLQNLPLLNSLDTILDQIVKEYTNEISNIDNFDDVQLQDTLVYNYKCKQYETIKSMYESFYGEEELQDLYQKVCTSHARLKYYTQIIDFYYALNSKIRNPPIKNGQQMLAQGKLTTHINFNLNQLKILTRRIDETKKTDILQYNMESHKLFYIINWLTPLKIDKCCSFEQKYDFSKYVNPSLKYRSEFFSFINKKLLKRKGIKNSWFVSDTKRLDSDGQIIDLLHYVLSPQFWSSSTNNLDPLRLEITRSFNVKADQLSDPDVIYVNLNKPSLSYYKKVVDHIATSVYRMMNEKLHDKKDI